MITIPITTIVIAEDTLKIKPKQKKYTSIHAASRIRITTRTCASHLDMAPAILQRHFPIISPSFETFMALVASWEDCKRHPSALLFIVPCGRDMTTQWSHLVMVGAYAVRVWARAYVYPSNVYLYAILYMYMYFTRSKCFRLHRRIKRCWEYFPVAFLSFRDARRASVRIRQADVRIRRAILQHNPRKRIGIMFPRRSETIPSDRGGASSPSPPPWPLGAWPCPRDARTCPGGTSP